MSENQSNSRKQGMEKYFFRASAADFRKITGSPIAYWVSANLARQFSSTKVLSDVGRPRQGLASTNNGLFYRYWHEVELTKTGFGMKSRVDAFAENLKWFPLNKGGGFRRWAGNNEWVINFENDGKTICDYIDNTPGARVGSNGRVINREFYFQPGISYSDLTTGGFGARYFGVGYIFDTTGPSIFDEGGYGIKRLLAYVNTKLFQAILDTVCTGLHYSNGVLAGLPVHFPDRDSEKISANTEALIESSRSDWDSYETAWDFTSAPLLHPNYRQPKLKGAYQTLRAHWREVTLDMQRLEQENNRIFIDAYGLQDELKPEVPLNEITLTCNPHYRYGGDKSDEELEVLLLADTMRELVSYAVGCMLGRYSLDKPGLILANQGETLADYLIQVPQPSFPADDDNVIPVLDGDWFADDITLRFRQFLRVAFGDEHYDENLAFIEQALNVKGKRNYSLRDYFLSEFYADHVKRYKKRPIYWLFSSPKGSFSALIYMHRYRPDTVSVVLKYLRDYREKLSTEKDRQASVSINPATSQGDKTRALKEVDRLAKVLAELEDYERDVLYPLATEQKPIDLDDGVKVNYLKFGAALKKITGLDAKEED